MPVVKTKWPLIFLLLIAGLCRFLVESKIFERCELAKLLHQQYRLNLAEVAQWVCIAQHSSGYNTTAQATSPTGGSHGLFQVSDVYWCSPPGKGGGCNLPCQRLRDDDLSDDLSCIQHIYDAHQRISGDGYTAWNAYPLYCQDEAASYIQDCFAVKEKESTKGYNPQRERLSGNAIDNLSTKNTGKVYERCELARELHNKHKISMQQIPTWVCIVQHESRFNTAAVGRLNADGSADHGLFQISDLYWCSHDRYGGGGKACGLSCTKLLDNDITDDVRCIKRIYKEHTALSGDGFNAWTVYKPHCQNQSFEKVSNCFKDIEHGHRKEEVFGFEESSNQIQTTIRLDRSHQKNPFFKYSPSIYNDIFKTPSYVSTKSLDLSQKRKVYTRCSLAQELYFKHKFPIQDVATWVCIAEHESQFNTAALGKLNTDGSTDHGIFQINDRYWCDHSPHGGKGCDLSCNKLLDENLKDDVACIRTIHEEHNRLSGNGFNAWTVYKRHCQDEDVEHIQTCFDANSLDSFEIYEPSPSINIEVIQSPGKIYDKCELAEELYRKHDLPMEQIPTWVCIAQHESSMNTAAIGRLNADGSADHGLFQISDLYWCSHDQHDGKACNIPCDKLIDSDISDDVECIKIIYEEHTRISGDGFNAWTVYQPHCHTKSIDHIKECFTDDDLNRLDSSRSISNSNSLIPVNSLESKPTQKGKVYKKCELAQELYGQHHIPMDQIPKWVCIAQYESSYNTAAIGRLNTDGSADHGLFQISDLYWCSHDRYGGKACNIPCHKLTDSDISDDIKCIQTIHEEHTRISGDGFNAWTVYQPHCSGTGLSHVKDCFTATELEEAKGRSIPANAMEPVIYTSVTKTKVEGKIYQKCELAQELLTKHRMPMEQISTWVCIAQHESSLNTAAVGRLNTDGSLDYGLFQISDLYWCSRDQYGGGKACNMPCNKLLDSDITDDVECIKIIYEEHTRISGDGFNAWTVYKPHCHHRKIEEVHKCFSPNQIEESKKQPDYAKKGRKLHFQPVPQTVSYSKNPFLSGLQQRVPAAPHPNPLNANDSRINFSNQNDKYSSNPFLKNIKLNSDSGEVHETKKNSSNSLNKTNQSNNQQNSFIKSPAQTEHYRHNPFLSGLLKPSTSAKLNALSNPFLNGNISSMVSSKVKPKTSEIVSGPTTAYANNPFLKKIVQSSPPSNPPFLEKHKMYLNSKNFRTTTTSKPKAAFTTTAATTTTKQQTTTKTPMTSTTKKPTAERSTTTQKLSTTKQPLTNTLSTKSAKTGTTWSWQNQKYYSTTTRKPPTTTTTKQARNKEYHNSTTTKPPKTRTTQQIQRQKYTDNKISTTARTTTAKTQKTTTMHPVTTTENWRKWNTITTTTPRPITTTTNSRASKLMTAQKSTTTKAFNSTDNWRKWDKTTTIKPSHKTTKTPKATSNSGNKQKSATTKPPGSTENWRKWDKTTTKNPNGIKSSTGTENWRKWDKLTTKRPAHTTTNPSERTRKLINERKSATTKSLSTTENWRKWDRTTTIKPSHKTTKTHHMTSDSRNEQKSTTNTTTAKTTTITTTTPTRSENYNHEKSETATLKPYESTTTTTTTTTTLKPLTTNPPTINTENSNYKENPFSHPFFAKVSEQLKQMYGNFTT